MKPLKYQTTLLSLMLLISSAAQAESVTPEVEANHPLNSAQEVAIPAGNVTINGALGNTSGTVVDDIDYFAFNGTEGDIVTIDIDGGMGGLRTVDTVLTVFDINGEVYFDNDDVKSGVLLDEGSISRYDARIENIRLPASGRYTVAVTNSPRKFNLDGTITSNRLANGDYKLQISGVTLPIQQINIDIKPGNDGLAPINPRSKGKIPVALLSSSEFNALNVDTHTLTFGSTGKEVSLSHCNPEGVDINNDGFVDLVCHFENEQAGFVQGDSEATLSGKLKGGSLFEGKGLLKVKGEKRSGF